MLTVEGEGQVKPENAHAKSNHFELHNPNKSAHHNHRDNTYGVCGPRFSFSVLDVGSKFETKT